MFGYINPDAPYLFKKDETLYKALYCGLCKGIGKGCGQCARSALTYDMAFMSAILHNIRHEDVDIKKKRCALHIIRPRPIAAVDETTVLLGCVNTALAYYKLCDDKQDGERRGIFRHAFKRGLKRAIKRHPQAVEIIKEQTEKQSRLEKDGCSVIDMACEPTAEMMQSLSSYALGSFATPHTDKLFYSIGKWVYLADALDDFEKDIKKGRFNILKNAIGGQNKYELLQNGEKELAFIFDSLFADMRESLANIKFKFNHDLTDNIILRGIPVKTRALLSCGNCKHKKKEIKNEQKQS